MLSFIPFLLFGLHGVLAAPALTLPPVKVPSFVQRQLSLEGLLGSTRNTVNTTIESVDPNANGLVQFAGAVKGILNDVVPREAPTSVSEALQRLSNIQAARPQGLLEQAVALVSEGLVPADVAEILAKAAVRNNQNNDNPPPKTTIYPEKDPADAPYDISEEEMRSKIYIPPGFTYGEKQPLLFVPGTGNYAGTTFSGNYGKLLEDSPDVDPVYLNVPNNLLNDIQTNAEYFAYAVNYLNSITDKKVVVVGWSQASLLVRWAEKYWPSINSAMSTTAHISPDYHGTILAYLLCPTFPRTPCAPAVLQQQYASTFVATLRNNGGDSPYTPLTSVYSIFDEVVQPQALGPLASGFSSDERDVGVTNAFLQDICTPLLPGGALQNTHEGVLYNALGVALAFDSFKTGKNGDLANVDTLAECSKLAADGLTLADILATEAAVLIALFNVLTPPNPTTVEPRIKDYARKDIPPGYED